MAKKKADDKKDKKEGKPEKKARVHPELEGFEIKINPLGDISSNFNIDQLNQFLDRNVTDKKLVGDQGKKRPGEEDEDFPIEEHVDEEENEEEFFSKSRSAPEEDDEDLKKPSADDDDDEDVPKPKPKKK